MNSPSLSIVTTTYNCVENILSYIDNIKKIKPVNVDWVIIDAGSDDGTSEILKEHMKYFTYYESRPDSGFYYGLNDAVKAVKTDYYIVLGSDDQLDVDFFSKFLKAFDHSIPDLIIGGVRLSPSKKVKLPGKIGFHCFSIGRVISHHSVGCVIRKALHEEIGYYDTTYNIVADCAFIKKIIVHKKKIFIDKSIFGEFCESGFSSNNDMLSIIESFRYQVVLGKSYYIQLFLLVCRLVKFAFKKKRPM